jgi:hypothetical protein
MASGFAGLYGGATASGQSSDGNTFMNNQASMNKQLRAFIDNLHFEDQAVLCDIYTDALLHLCDEI